MSGTKYPGQLSGGQQQRIALARALATAPGLLLLDEPLSALDAIERVRLRGEIRALQQRLGVTTIMVTHDQEEALSMADRIVVMNAGRIEQVGTPREIYEMPATPFVADFVGKINVLPAVAEGGGRFRVGSVSLAAARPRRSPPGTRGQALPASRGNRASTRTARRRATTLAGARSRKIEFLGAFCMVGIALDAAGAPALVANVPRQSGRRGAARAGPAGHGEPAAGGAARARLTARMATPAARAARRSPLRRRVKPHVHWQDRLAQGLLLVCCAALALFLLGAAGDDPGQERAGQGRRVRRPRCSSASTSPRRRCAARSGTRCGSRRWSRRSPCRSRSSTPMR